MAVARRHQPVYKKKLDGTPAKTYGGRPTAMTPDVIMKLESVFAIDGTMEEACSFAEISRPTLNEYLKRNPDFANKIADLRQRPFLKARNTIVKSLDQPGFAMEYMKRKKRGEFGDGIDLTSGGDKVALGVVMLPKRDDRKSALGPST